MPGTNTDETIDYFVPDGSTVEDALARTTHLAIVAHQDDLEINCFHGIAECYQHPERWFTGIVLSDGAGSPRSGKYTKVSDAEMVMIRQREQRSAATTGHYSLAIQCGVSSSALKASLQPRLVAQLTRWLDSASPQCVYLHNLTDRHDTHLHSCVYALEALRRLPADKHPGSVYGVEGWGSLDWLPEKYRVRLDVGAWRELSSELIVAFDSQISGGKRYDLAAQARHLSNATFDQSHVVDASQYMSLAMDLNPLVRDPSIEYRDFIAGMLESFSSGLLESIPPREIDQPPG